MKKNTKDYLELAKNNYCVAMPITRTYIHLYNYKGRCLLLISLTNVM